MDTNSPRPVTQYFLDGIVVKSSKDLDIVSLMQEVVISDKVCVVTKEEINVGNGRVYKDIELRDLIEYKGQYLVPVDVKYDVEITD